MSDLIPMELTERSYALMIQTHGRLYDLRELCVIRIFSDYSILGKIFHTPGAAGGGRSINLVARALRD